VSPTALVTGYSCSRYLGPLRRHFRYLYIGPMGTMVRMETYQVTMTVDEPTRKHLEEEAERRHRSMSYIARELVHESLPDDIEPAEVGP
jgi:hypothetical protein